MSHPECQKEDAAFDAWCDNVITELEETKRRILGDFLYSAGDEGK